MTRVRMIPEVIQRPVASNAALMALANHSPKLKITLQEGANTAPVSVTRPSDVVTGLGLSSTLEAALGARVADWILQEHRLHAAKIMKVDLNGSVSDPRQRAEITRRFWQLWRKKKGDRPSLKLRKSLTEKSVVLILKAAGLKKG